MKKIYMKPSARVISLYAENDVAVNIAVSSKEGIDDEDDFLSNKKESKDLWGKSSKGIWDE